MMMILLALLRLLQFASYSSWLLLTDGTDQIFDYQPPSSSAAVAPASHYSALLTLIVMMMMATSSTVRQQQMMLMMMLSWLLHVAGGRHHRRLLTGAVAALPYLRLLLHASWSKLLWTDCCSFAAACWLAWSPFFFSFSPNNSIVMAALRESLLYYNI